MKGVICNYAPVRFLPYRETGEFVNFGVVVFCPQARVFTFRLASRRHKRISDFFPELDIKIFKAAIRGLENELQQLPFTGMQQSLLPSQNWNTVKQSDRFAELIRVREGLIHFGNSGTLIATSANAALDQLYERYVARLFAKGIRYQEGEMRKRLHVFLNQWRLSGAYKYEQSIGDSDFHVRMPFVFFNGNSPEKVIKPLDLNKDTPFDIYDHGGVWIERIRRLKTRKCLPPKVIFPIAYPDDSKRRDAAKNITEEMNDLGVTTVPYSDSPQDIERLHKLAAEGVTREDWNN